MSTIMGIIFITILSIGVVTLSFASDCKIYYVKPTNESQTECPKQPNVNCTCLTLYEYARDAERFFPSGSNTTLSFLAGDHFLNTTLTINSATCHLLKENTSRLQTHIRKPRSRIHFKNDAKILFKVCGASITGLDFLRLLYIGKLSNRSAFRESDIDVMCNDLCCASLTLVGDTRFTNVSIYLQYANLTILGNVTFDYSYDSNSGILSGIYCNLKVQSDAVVTFDGMGSDGGNGLRLQYCNATISGHVLFQNSIADYGGGISVVCSQNDPCTLTVDYEGILSFLHNSACHSGGAMYLKYVNIQLQGKIYLENNSANGSGGAMYLHSSFLYFWPTALLTISSNHAGRFGGAIYIYDTSPYSYCLADLLVHTEDCFFQVVGRNVSQKFDIQMVFKNNTANLGGDTLYGGAVDHCTLKGNYNNSAIILDELTNILKDNSSISSEPFKLLFCKPRGPFSSTVEVYPGQSLPVSMVTFGQRNGTAPSTIQASLFSNDNDNDNRVLALAKSEVYQQSNRGCTVLNYTMFSGKVGPATLILSTNGTCSSFATPLQIPVHFQDCPTGFMLSNNSGSCICEERLQKYTQNCDIIGQKILRNGTRTFWVGYDNASDGLILYPHCPFDYCKSKAVEFTLNETFLQCDHNSTGLLCGACQDGLSLVLGSSKCKQCSNAYLSLLVVFTLAGPMLVVLLLACKLTVAVGTISGLIFYANIIAFNKALFLPHGNINFITVFISWVNLDLGIEVCFYDGMDAYAKVLLQFAFPFYIWSIIILIIIINRSRFAVRTSRLLGSNPIAALTTPLLLSYAKVLRAIASVLSFAKLEYPTEVKTVWLYDGNTKFFHGKYIALVVLALIIFFLFFLPYTLLLLLGHWLQTKSHLWALAWINSPRVKFFLDAHYAPYKDKHRYWPGLLLLVQCALLFNTDDNVTLLSISAATLGIATWVWNFGSVFKFWYLNALEGSFILNLGLLAAGTHYVRNAGGNQAALTHASIGVAFTTFLGIVIYHICLQVNGTNLFAQCKDRYLYSFGQERVQEQSNVRVELSQTISETVSLIGSERMPRFVDFSKPREPLLES